LTTTPHSSHLQQARLKLLLRVLLRQLMGIFSLVLAVNGAQNRQNTLLKSSPPGP
jgi:hypothetical protein